MIKNDENNEIISEDYCEWNVDNFSDIKNNNSSPEFVLLNYKW